MVRLECSRITNPLDFYGWASVRVKLKLSDLTVTLWSTLRGSWLLQLLSSFFYIILKIELEQTKLEKPCCGEFVAPSSNSPHNKSTFWVGWRCVATAFPIFKEHFQHLYISAVLWVLALPSPWSCRYGLQYPGVEHLSSLSLQCALNPSSPRELKLSVYLQTTIFLLRLS